MTHRQLRAVLRALALCLACAALAGPSATASAKAPSPAPLIVIDAGHGGRYSNANRNGLREKNVNLAIAKELRTALLARGYRVIMTRTTDRAVVTKDIRTWNWSAKKKRWSYSADGRKGNVAGIPKDDLQGRVDIANAAGADLFISIHGNGSRKRSTRGTETWTARRDKLGTSLGSVVHRSVVKATKLRNHGTHRADFYVNRWSNMPGILVETAFISSPRDAALLKKASFRRKLAVGIANGVDSWMNKNPCAQKYPRVSAASPSELAAAVSKADFGSHVPAAVVVRSDHAADVPGAAGLAARLGAPLLLADASGPDEATADELAHLKPQRVVVAGVEGSFDASAVASLAQASSLPTSAVEVVSDVDRSSLSASIATRVGVPPNGEVFIAAATDTYSTSAAAPLSASHGMPLLLVSGGQLSAQSIQWLEANRPAIRRLILVGSARSVPLTVASGFPVTRIDGVHYADRASRLNARYFTTNRSRALRPVVASLPLPAEYLVAASRSGRRMQPLIPVSSRVLPTFTREWISNRRAPIGGFEIVTGGSIPYLMDHMLAKAEYL